MHTRNVLVLAAVTAVAAVCYLQMQEDEIAVEEETDSTLPPASNLYLVSGVGTFKVQHQRPRKEQHTEVASAAEDSSIRNHEVRDDAHSNHRPPVSDRKRYSIPNPFIPTVSILTPVNSALQPFLIENIVRNALRSSYRGNIELVVFDVGESPSKQLQQLNGQLQHSPKRTLHYVHHSTGKSYTLYKRNSYEKNVLPYDLLV